MKKINKLLILVFLFCFITIFQNANAATGGEIDASVNAALESFYLKVKNGEELIQGSKGALIFPRVFKAGFVVGGEYGEGALRINNKTVDYYNIVTGTLGFQLGIQKKTIIILFMEEEALSKFQQSSNWKAGIDASVAIITVGIDGAIDTAKLNKPIIAFIVGQKGLMYNLTLEGSKISKVNK